MFDYKDTVRWKKDTHTYIFQKQYIFLLNISKHIYNKFLRELQNPVSYKTSPKTNQNP